MAFANDTKIMFKSGSQSKLDQLTSYVPGTFYLTEDTKRLYIGNSEGKKDLLNSIVEFVSNVSALNEKVNAWKQANINGKDHENDIVYITGSNILATWVHTGASHSNSLNGYEWVQINPDTNTVITNSELSVESIANGASINSYLKDSANNDWEDAVSIVGDGKSIVVAKKADSEKVIELKGDSYSIGIDTATAANGADAFEIELTSALGQDSSSVKVIAGKNVNIAKNGNDIEISSDNWLPKESNSGVELSDNGVFTVTFSDGKDEVSAVSSPISYNVGVNTTEAVNLGQDLSMVYTKNEIDSLFRNLNGMTYKGTLSTSNAGSIYKIENGKVFKNGEAVSVSIGDMFVASQDIITDGLIADKGDIIIAGGEETNGVLSAITWSVIESGDDLELDTTYSFAANNADHSLTVTQNGGENEGPVGKIALVAGTGMAISSTVGDGTELTATITHANVNPVTETAVAGEVVQSGTKHKITVIESVEANAQGHVTKIVPKTFTLPEVSLSEYVLADVSTSNGPDEISITSGIQIDNNEADVDTFKIASNSLSLSLNAAKNTVNMELTWGSF